MKLPRIYDFFKQGTIFTIDEARISLQTTGNTLRKRLSELSSRGYLQPIRQGLYRVSLPNEILSQRAISPFQVASKITPNGYIAFQTALQFHANEVPKSGEPVFVVSDSKFNSFDFQENHYFWCQNPDTHGIETREIELDSIRFEMKVTTFEKTIVDCIKRMAHAPELDCFISLCKKAHSAPDLELVLKHANECSVAAVFNRIGFFFELMNGFWQSPHQFFAAVESRMSRKHTEWSSLHEKKQTTSRQEKWKYLGVSEELCSKWRIGSEQRSNTEENSFSKQKTFEISNSRIRYD